MKQKIHVRNILYIGAFLALLPLKPVFVITEATSLCTLLIVALNS